VVLWDTKAAPFSQANFQIFITIHNLHHQALQKPVVVNIQNNIIDMCGFPGFPQKNVSRVASKETHSLTPGRCPIRPEGTIFGPMYLHLGKSTEPRTETHVGSTKSHGATPNNRWMVDFKENAQ
jgi:hypothetical protein